MVFKRMLVTPSAAFHSLKVVLMTSFFFVMTSCSINGKIVDTSNKSSLVGGLSISDKVVVEYGIADVIVSLGSALSTDVTFLYYTQDVTAINGTDFISVSGLATIPAGSTQVILSIPIFDDYTKASANKKFRVQLTSVQGTETLNSAAEVTILDDELPSITSQSSITSGNSHACSITDSSEVLCWGLNSTGQLGDGTTTQSARPVRVLGISSVQQVTAGNGHTCALTISGGVKCWGRNNTGQLGDGGTTNSLTPVDVVGLTSGVSAISAGSSHSCALMSAGTVKCWGENLSGAIGDGTTTQRNTPTDVTGLLSSVTDLSSGASHNCVVLANPFLGRVQCWGRNIYGQIGDGSTTQRNSATSVLDASSSPIINIVKVKVSRDSHSCAITSVGGVKCWGRNQYGSLGDNTTTHRYNPVDVLGLSNVSDIVLGENHTCAKTSANSMSCWGYNSDGQLGDGTLTDSLVPISVSGMSTGVDGIAAGSFFSCALLSDGSIKCWGINSSGQIGNNFNSAFLAFPVDTMGLSTNYSRLDAGSNYTCALGIDGAMKCWGNNTSGQIGDGTVTPKSTPTSVVGIGESVSRISASGTGHTCVVTVSGAAKCWGNNFNGQLGDGLTSSRSSPATVTGLSSGISDITGGTSHTCALTTSGGMKCWGSNSNGRLGDGTLVQKTNAVDVTGLTTGVAAIEAWGSHTCALTTSGGVKCWGSNSNGQVGDGTTTQRPNAVDVIGLTSDIVDIAGGFSHTCALTTSGGVKCWGLNSSGQLGDGTTTQRTTAVDVVGLSSGVTAISAGQSHTCALTASGGVKCWGLNTDGQIGDGTSGTGTNRSAPVDVTGLSSGISSINAGGSFTCALTKLGGAKCWGSNLNGILGMSYSSLLPLPVVIPAN